MPKLSIPPVYLTPSPKVIGIVGSRRRDSDADFRLCLKAFEKVYKKGDRIVSGGCKEGGDRFAETIAKGFGYTITIHYPREEDIDRNLLFVNPRAAYAKINYARNTLIAEDCHILIALPAEDRKGGTEDTIKKVERMNKPIVLT